MTEESSLLHSRNSVLREIILEHLFVGELLRHLWTKGITDVEVLRSEFDAGGYDLVLSRGRLTRHIQLKSIISGGKAARVSISLRLAARPSGCVVWMVVTKDLELDHFLWFGEPAGNPLEDIEENKTTLHSKGNSQGVKLKRPGHRDVSRSAFTKVKDLPELCDKLLGDLRACTRSTEDHSPLSSPG